MPTDPLTFLARISIKFAMKTALSENSPRWITSGEKLIYEAMNSHILIELLCKHEGKDAALNKTVLE